MAAPVRMEASVFGDPRYDLLGQLAGYNAHEARGRMALLWSVCTERNTSVVTPAIVRACIGPAGVEALVGAELGEVVEGGGVRVRGTTKERIGWYSDAVESRRALAQQAGKARAAGASRNQRGQLVSSVRPAGDQPATSAPLAGDQREPASRSRSRSRSRSQPPSGEDSPATPELFPDSTNGKGTKAAPEAPSDHHAFIARFNELYAEANGGSKPTWGDGPGAHVKRLLKAHGLAECLKRADNLFRAPPDWPTGNDFKTFVLHFDKFATPYAPRARNNGNGGRGLTPQEIMDLDMNESPFRLKGES